MTKKSKQDRSITHLYEANKNLREEIEKSNIKNVNLSNEVFTREMTISNIEQWIDLIRAICGGLGSIIIFVSLFFDYIAQKLLLNHNPGIDMFQVLGVVLGSLIWCIAIYRHRE